MQPSRQRNTQSGRTLATALFFGLALLATSRSTAQDIGLLQQIESTNIRIIEKAEPSVVAIARVRKDRPTAFAVPGRERQQQNTRPDEPDFVPNDFGAGVIIETKNRRHPRLILTNYHVVRGGPVFGRNSDDDQFDLWVTIAARRPFKADIIAADPHSDLAVLTIGSLEPNQVSPLKPTPNQPRKGQFVFALGNPYSIAKDGSASSNWGIVSNVLRSPHPNTPDWQNEFRLFDNVHQFGTLMQIGVSLPLGTSGGALLNLKGELIGITTSLAPLKGYEQSAGYAVPFTPGFIRVIDQLTMGYEVEYGFLGIRPANARPADFDGLEFGDRPQGGCVVVSVSARSAAALGGLKPGDVIVAVDDKPVANSEDLMRDVGLIGPNQKTVLKVWRPRDQRFLKKTVTLSKWPVQNDGDIIATAFEFPAWRGIRVDYATARSRFLRLGGAVEIAAGVVVVAVDEATQGIKIQPGDFITRVGETKVASPAEFRNAVKPLGGKEVVLLTNDGRKITIAP